VAAEGAVLQPPQPKIELRVFFIPISAFFQPQNCISFGGKQRPQRLVLQKKTGQLMPRDNLNNRSQMVALFPATYTRLALRIRPVIVIRQEPEKAQP